MREPGSVQSVDRALRLLETLANRAEGMRLSDLARAEGLAPSTTHRLLTALEQRGFVQVDPVSMCWLVGQRAFSVGIAFTRWQSLIATALPFLRRLRDETRETVNLGVLDTGEVVTVAQAESREITRAIAPPGGRTPVMNSAMGKAILATWPDAEIEAQVARHGLRPMTSHSLKSLAEAQAEIARIRAQGHAFDNQEYRLGMRCVAAVIQPRGAEAAAALSVSGLALRVTPELAEALAPKVRETARALSEALSHAAERG
jgi:IclR family acetate operon transcriptional repressor